MTRQSKLKKWIATLPLVARNDNHGVSSNIIAKGGFTLAEVLITLTIIGVIAALTIPNLLQKHQEHELITRLKKAHSVMSNAYAQAIRENGPAEDWDLGQADTAEGATKLYNYLKPYLKVQKECGNKSGCFATHYKALFNDSYWVNLDTEINMNRFLLDDGMSGYLWSSGTGCTRNNSKTNIAPLNQKCGEFSTDVNGKKGPNKVGVDVFAFILTQQGTIIPFGTSDFTNPGGNKCKYKDTNNKNGVLCTAWALYKGNMDYLRRDISTEWPWLK